MSSTGPFRNPQTTATLAKAIRREAGSPAVDDRHGRRFQLMEVCGTHTVAIYRFGLRSILPENVCLISGPGCPVCVTPVGYIDHAIALARRPDVTVATFGDLLRVPGSSTSLENARAEGADVRVLTSPVDAVDLAVSMPDRQVVFLGVGFETTVPAVALAVRLARERDVENFSVLSGHKTMPRALRALVDAASVNISGFLMPGHVSAVIGSRPYEFLAEEFDVPSVVTGFEPVDVLQGILMLMRQINEGRPRVEIQYTRAVAPEGNPKAWAAVEEQFKPCASTWRGIGTIADSGLELRPEHARFDAAERLPVEIEPTVEPQGCICGRILQGVNQPGDCPLFADTCTPEHPVGACMVSSEGSCAAAFKYGPRN